ncbi:hypothetical protein RM704_10465 [Streptomyces sp. DSM 3412]|uniref:Uncharacterized protein n=1 Tax=Streptomyces gottesmaniae TaxID=3075518 RepID=A0ABU2YXG4_9ACTN|nr:hypothetical protein [Streptomyces sp. DSM 3412]MDT0567887.1 hypothetical protein [Streptomyces sp. DSM 3412]
MSQPQTGSAGEDRARTHIKALLTEAKVLTEGTAGTTAMAFGSGMLTGLAASVQILDGGTAEAAMETIVQRLEASIGTAYLDGSLPPTPSPARDQIVTVIREFPFDNYAMDDVSYSLADRPETQEWVPALADAVLASVPNDPELRHQLKAAIAALGKSETELAQCRRRNRLAHKARRAKEHQLDGIRRALCDIGAIQDDDPYSHADLEDVIRQAGRLDELTAAVAADLDSYGEDEDQHCGPVVPPSFMDTIRQDETARVEHAAAVEAATAPAWLREQIAVAVRSVLYQDLPGDMGQHVADAVLAVILPVTRITAALTRDSEAAVQRVIALYERWVKAGPPRLGTSLARSWDERLVELREAVLGTKDPS